MDIVFSMQAGKHIKVTIRVPAPVVLLLLWIPA